MPQFKLIPAGTRFGRLIVIGPPITKSPTTYPCICDCGLKTSSAAGNLRNGTASSCGCKRRETLSRIKTTHGDSRTPLHVVWCGMKARCYNKNHIAYRYYGAKGIAVGRTFKDFSRFKNWAIKEGYKSGLSIERKNTKLGYTPKNCTWSDSKTQNRNSGSTHKIRFQGKNLCLEEWAEITGIKAPTMRGRLKKGWTIWKTLTTKTRPIKRR